MVMTIDFESQDYITLEA